MRTVYRIFISIILLALLSATGHAQLKIPCIISSNMVLQRNIPVPVWGRARPGAQVQVIFGRQVKNVTTDMDGNWKIHLQALKTSDIPQEMIISSDTSTIRLSNILVGEVWMCSGQSNMEYPMKLTRFALPKKGADSAALELVRGNPEIRLFIAQKVYKIPANPTGGWEQAAGKPLEDFSAAGYFFAKNLQEKLQVPVGVIESAIGGTRIEPWTPASGYSSLAAFQPETAHQPFLIDSVSVGKLYQNLVEPLSPFALHGFLWYQGESNCANNDGMRYADKMQALISSWRKEWGNDRLPFYSVLLAPLYYTHRKDPKKHTEETLPEIREAQMASLQIPATGIISITDLVDNMNDIHPSYKWEVGRRLASLALAKDYGFKKIVYSGPQYDYMQVWGSTIALYFKYAAGLKCKDDKPAQWFTIAGTDGKFLPATKVEINGDKVLISNSSIVHPVAARMGWNEIAEPNLINAAGLPAIPFRTDNVKWDDKK